MDTTVAETPEPSSSTGSTPMAPNRTSQGGKVKQTRRRQRLSCVECTKRRQKCDRQFPCGLCTTRGIPDLCRWEPIVVRPTPQRPPVEAINATASATIDALSARIATLERALFEQRNSNSQASSSDNDASPSPAATHRSSQSPGVIPEAPAEISLSGPSDEPRGKETEDGPRALIDYDVQVAAVALAQLSLAPRTEYVGSGTVLCAIHKLGDPDSWRFPHPKTMLTSPVSTAAAELTNRHNRTWEILSECTAGLGNMFPYNDGSSPNAIRCLVSKLPPRPQLEELLTSFFAERNWQFGIPERWFRSAYQKMWEHLDLRCMPGCRGSGDCSTCREDINPHWLSLLFAVLALAPGRRDTSKNGAQYFIHALTARRLVEDILLVTPVYSTSEGTVHGGVLSCYSSVLLAMYLVDRGRVSEAWKLVGSAIRIAQALGMHRDPGWRKWEEMRPIDRELRVTSWWLLMVSDRMWSFILGRPPMVSPGTYDVLALPSDISSDGSPNPCAAYHNALIGLSEVIADTMDKCLGIRAPPYAAVLEMDRRFQDWEARLPDKLRWRRTSAAPSPSSATDDSLRESLDYGSTSADRFIAYQRHTLAGWYLCGLMNLHRPYLMHPPPILPPPGASSGPQTKLMLNPSRERCIDVALEITRVMCEFHRELAPWREPGRLNASVFSYFLFDGAVALAGALSQVPPHPQSQECLSLMDKAMRVLDECAKQAQGSLDGEGEMGRRAIIILKALRKAGGWDKRDEEKGELVLLQDMLRQERRQTRLPQPTNQRDSLASGTDFFSTLGSISSTQYPASSSFFGAQTTTNQASSNSSFIPYLSNSAYNMTGTPAFVNTPGLGMSVTGSVRSYAPLSPSLGDFDMSFTPGVRTDMMRPAQSMVMPFDVLQGVQPDSNDMQGLELDWAKIAGMESWYSGNSTDGGSGVSG